MHDSSADMYVHTRYEGGMLGLARTQSDYSVSATLTTLDTSA